MTTRAIDMLHAAKLLAALLVAAGLISPAAAAGNAALEFLQQRVAADPLDNVAQARLALEYVNAMRTSGDLGYLRRAEQAARASLRSVPAPRNPEGLTALAVALYESHRFKEALQLAQQAAAIDPGSVMAVLLIGDAQYEMGDYRAAEQTYAKLANGRAREVVTIRRARLLAARGESQTALEQLSRLLSTANESLQVHVRLQLAELHFARGDFAPARVHLEVAQQLEPSSYVVQEHLAELLAAEGRLDAAEALYRKVISRVPRPELMHALGDLYQLMERPKDAREWLERAEAGYLRSAQQGNAHYYHHLASYFSDSNPQPEQALRWAREDSRIRASASAHDALAWALYKNGEYQAAAETMNRALAVGTGNAHLLFHAGTIYMNAGRIAQGRQLLERALAINPRYNTFHVHR